ncbi:MAG: clostripain-related cysteine peptidase, partial [Fimbriimonadaceae bacterium]
MDSGTQPARKGGLRPGRAFVVALAALALLFGAACGGGGGGSSASLTYTTDWGAGSASVTGVSQRVSVYTLDNRLVESILLNETGGGTQEHRFSLSRSGTFRLVAELFSGVNASGVRTGLIDTALPIRGSTVFSSAVGLEPTSVSVTPSSVTFRVPESRRFFAVARAGDRAVFTAPGGFEWSILGGNASVNSEGVVSAEAAGPGSVRATHVDTGLSGSAIFTIQAFNAERRKWTVLVFMNAGNDLHPFATLNVNQMERVADNPDVRFVVQWKQTQQVWPASSFDGTRRILVRPDNTSAIVSEVIQDLGTGVDMGRAETLRDFIQWGKTYFPADRYVLVVWNHGNGWRRSNRDLPSRAVSYDDQFGSSIQIWEMAQALGDNRFDIIAWDASLMQMIEVAYEVKDHADFVAGSEESPPGEGYPYHLVFAPFRNNPDLPTATLSKGFVDGMLQFYGNNQG